MNRFKTPCNECKQLTYDIKTAHLKTFGDPFVPYLRFDQILNVAQWYRDVFYGPDNIDGFAQDFGDQIMVWTSQTVTNYLRHIVPDDLDGDVTISFEVPHLQSAAWFPLVIRIYDERGLFFLHEQKLVVERKVNDRFVLTSWRKVPALSDFLLSQLA